MAKRAPKMMVPALLSFWRTKAAGNSGSILKKPEKILLVKQSERLGNIVLMNSGIDALRRAIPETRIDLLLPAAYAGVMAANSTINKIIPIEKKKYITRPWLLIQTLGHLRRQRYDLAIDCSDVNSHSSTGAAYTLMAGARLTAGWRTGRRTIFDIEVERYTEIAHASEMYLRLFSGIFKRKLEGDPYFQNTQPKGGCASRTIGINCGGRGSKRWPLESFIDVGRRLASEGYQVDFILGPDESLLRAKLEMNLPSDCQLLPLLSLPGLMEKMKSYALFISSDTGPMHLAWCLGLPVIAIFLDSELPKFGPLSPGSAAIDAKDGIKPEEVFERAMRILKAGKVPA